jgi:hypothetical protein
MKAINIIISALFLAVAFSTYLLVAKLFPQAEPTDPGLARVESAKQAAAEPGAMPQPHMNNPAAFASPQTSIREPQAVPRAALLPPVTAPVKEEPKLRHVRDIKVVLYMTDW